MEECHAKDIPEALPLLDGYESSLVLTKHRMYNWPENEDLHKRADSIFDPATREKAWQIVDEILGRSTGDASVHLKTEVVFKKILQELNPKKKFPRCWC